VAPACAERIVGREVVDSRVAIRDLRVSDEAVTGRLVNLTSNPIRDIRLAVSDEFLWNNETRPGDDSPGRVEFVTVRGEIPPRGEVAFRVDRQPLPERSDGRFVTDVDVVGLEDFADSTASREDVRRAVPDAVLGLPHGQTRALHEPPDPDRPDE
jgi:hypothetical protein